MVSGLSRSAKS
ncbi:hypothetical protein D018_5170A, partial [Vibrio parahaemolyticus VP2007-007]